MEQCMRGLYDNRIHAITLLLGATFMIIFLTGCVGLKPAPPKTSIKINGKNEVLVAKDVSNVRPFWCGRKAILVYSTESKGVFYYDLKSGKKVNIANWRNTPLVCTPDGEWIIYADKYSYRRDAGSLTEAVVDLWRYEIKTGRNQKFAIADDGYIGSVRGLLSVKNGFNIYLGREPVERIKMPEPRWEVMWSQRKSPGDVWFEDGSANIGAYMDFDRRRYVLEVEVLGPERRFFGLYPPFRSFFPFLADNKNRVYIKIDEKKEIRIERCALDLIKESISCRPVLRNMGYIRGFDLFPDNETIVFTRNNDRCVRFMRIGEKKAACLRLPEYHMGNYVVLSHDGRWMVFTVTDGWKRGSIQPLTYMLSVL